MISAQANILNFILKYVFKPLQTNIPITPSLMQSTRKAFDVLSFLPAKVPSFVSIEPVRNGKITGEWVEAGDSIDTNRVLLYLHGGGYFFGSPKSHRPITWRLSRKAGLKVLSLQYRMLPNHLIGDAMEDAVTAYEWLLNQGYNPENITIGGDSAGGGLTLITLLELKNRNLPQPKAAFCLSPYTDITGTSKTIETNAVPSIMFHKNALIKWHKFMQESHDPYDPLVSPRFGDFGKLPSLFIQVGSSELLLEDTKTIVQKAEEAGTEVVCKVWYKMPHVFTIFSDFLPEGKQGIQEVADFLKNSFNSSKHAWES